MSMRPPENESELIELIRSIDVRAPEELHRRTEALIAERTGASDGADRSSGRSPGARLGHRLRLGGPLGLVVAAVAIALVVILSGGGGSSSPLSVRAAAALTLRRATMGAPAEQRGERASLTANVDGVVFPYWGERFGWRTSGSRSDRIGGRAVRTVFYSDSRGQRVGYAIVGGSPPPDLSGGLVRWRGGTPYRLITQGNEHIVAWLREGHLCVVAGREVSPETLLRLASWDEHPAAA
jgi:hypothetical protein